MFHGTVVRFKVKATAISYEMLFRVKVQYQFEDYVHLCDVFYYVSGNNNRNYTVL